MPKTRDEVLKQTAKELLTLAKGGQPNPTPGSLFYTLRQDLADLIEELERQAYDQQRDPNHPEAYLHMLEFLRDTMTDRINRY